MGDVEPTFELDETGSALRLLGKKSNVEVETMTEDKPLVRLDLSGDEFQLRSLNNINFIARKSNNSTRARQKVSIIDVSKNNLTTLVQLCLYDEGYGRDEGEEASTPDGRAGHSLLLCFSLRNEFVLGLQNDQGKIMMLLH